MKAPDRTALLGRNRGWLAKVLSCIYVRRSSRLLANVVHTIFSRCQVKNLTALDGYSQIKLALELLLSLLLFCCFLIPSMLWLESTSFHLRTDYYWTPILVIGILALASIGNIMFILIGFAANADGASYGLTIAIGGLMISIQCILNDLIIWSLKFLW